MGRENDFNHEKWFLHYRWLVEGVETTVAERITGSRKQNKDKYQFSFILRIKERGFIFVLILFKTHIPSL